MAAIAAFVTSDQGRLYGAICQAFGVDPGAGFTDDVVAFNLRAGLIVADPGPEEQAESPTDYWNRVLT